ncbi:MAG: lipid-A-disaccharide synthase [Syntrophales bacterium]|nr:lipid-A-disaccharide synthase [Syntrophales bacterium]MDD4338148.1 lipid-A-disaccharide synthase [Syntrophales bacterium]HOG07175.1 lipid-A-disaccharide synthase [Syntrophales bacterium]HOS76500.1 lipid-A-disaccharide synthase [Syntrophales bacterium]HPB69336.1 lipid-A-disaccharide synthase [Syntrophales bacterium]
MSGRRVMIVAGEASGDLHGARLVQAMRALDPALAFSGIGGRNLRQAGVRCLADVADMGVVGLTEVTRKLGTILRARRDLRRILSDAPPDLLILIDYPDFNLPLARIAKARGVPVLYYISPQIWAWRKGRLNAIRKCVDHMAVILPFEKPLYDQAGVPATFVGHPLLDALGDTPAPPEARRMFQLAEGVTTVALLPGSREGEARKLLPEMLGAARIIARELPPVQFVLPLADSLDPAVVEGIVRRRDLAVRIVRNRIYDVLPAADVALVASGTATLETALMNLPMVVVYKVSPLSYWVGRAFIHVGHISLVNIIAGKTVVPELIQGEAHANRMAVEVIDILSRKSRKLRMHEELSQIRARLGEPGAAAKTAALAMDLLNT